MVSSRATGPGSAWVDAAAVASVKSLATLAVLLAGFRAISDDDYARVTLAQRFVDSPALDPTASSWLPFPFYVYGGVLSVFGSSLAVARALGVALGMLSSLLVWGAARTLGLTPRAALLGALIAAVLPSAAYVGAATVPEAPTAALCVFGAACLGSGVRLRLLGALSLFVACGSRYEAWGVAGIFALITLYDAARKRSLSLGISGAVAAAFPLLWLLHGSFRHGDPTFFVSRVAAYRSALGPDADFLLRLVRAPLGFVTGEPELCVLAATLGILSIRELRARGVSQGSRRFALSLSALVMLVLVADLRGSAPTHHSGRALIAAWLGTALFVGYALNRELGENPKSRVLYVTALAALALSLGSAIRMFRPAESFADRRAEEDIGLRARHRNALPLAIDAPDFGYFAIQAALGAPERTFVIDERDPRRPRAPDLLESSARELAEQLSARNIRWLVTPRARAALTHSIGSVRDENAAWTLVELEPH